jgi:O-acetylhomoserine (thiol)-lyase
VIRSSEFELLSESVKQRQQQDGRQQILNRTDYERQRLREMAEKIARKDRNFKFETLQLHVGQENPDPVTDARAVPIYQTSSYVFRNCDHAAARFGLADAGNIYGRLTNPTEDVFEQRMAALEGGVAALAVASGAAAITYTIENLAQAGDHIVAAKNIYGGSFNLLEHTLPQYGIEATFVDPFNIDEVKAAIKDNTKALYIETLGNPNSDVVDIETLANIAHEHKIPLVIDNTFATPYLVRPIEYGADIVVHSATKFIGGHGTSIGGVIVDSGKFDWEASGKFASLVDPNPSYHGISFTKAVGPAAFVTKIRAILLRDTGATISPFNSFLFLQGLETLSLRVERHVENALKVVQYLNNHPQVERVHHPSVSEDPSQQALYKKYFPNGGGSIFTFEIKGDEQKAKDFIDNLELFSLLANVADVKSLVIHPATTTHSQCTPEELADQGIKPNTIRLSIGTENIDDIIQDLDEAFKAIQ